MRPLTIRDKHAEKLWDLNPGIDDIKEERIFLPVGIVLNCGKNIQNHLSIALIDLAELINFLSYLPYTWKIYRHIFPFWDDIGCFCCHFVNYAVLKSWFGLIPISIVSRTKFVYFFKLLSILLQINVGANRFTQILKAFS